MRLQVSVLRDGRLRTVLDGLSSVRTVAHVGRILIGVRRLTTLPVETIDSNRAAQTVTRTLQPYYNKLSAVILMDHR